MDAHLAECGRAAGADGGELRVASLVGRVLPAALALCAGRAADGDGKFARALAEQNFRDDEERREIARVLGSRCEAHVSDPRTAPLARLKQDWFKKQ